MGFEEFQNTIMGIEEIISISKSMGEDYAVLHGKLMSTDIIKELTRRGYKIHRTTKKIMGGTSGKLDWANFIVIDIRETTEE